MFRPGGAYPLTCPPCVLVPSWAQRFFLPCPFAGVFTFPIHSSPAFSPPLFLATFVIPLALDCTIPIMALVLDSSLVLFVARYCGVFQMFGPILGRWVVFLVLSIAIEALKSEWVSYIPTLFGRLSRGVLFCTVFVSS